MPFVRFAAGANSFERDTVGTGDESPQVTMEVVMTERSQLHLGMSSNE